MRETRPCAKREGTSGIHRCELRRGHSGPHRVELPNGTIEWNGRISDARPRRNSKISESDHQALAEAFTDGIKAQLITDQLLTHGEATCVRCGQTLAVMNDWGHAGLELGSPEYESAFARCLADAMEASAKHHTDRRRGHGYRPGKWGNDFGHDLPLLIEAPVCHPCHTGADSELHPGPQFSKSGAVE